MHPSPGAADLHPDAPTPAQDHRVLLFTDIVDSTQLNARLGDAAMAGLWQRHDSLSRELVRRWSGREIGRSDGFLLLFDGVADAVGFALDYHRALRTLEPPLQARAGLHRGPLTLRENSIGDREQGATRYEVDGATLPIAARIMSLALGGQTLLSADAARALGETPLRLQGHGFWRLKGVDDCLELFEIGEAGAPFTPPSDSAKAYSVVRVQQQWLPRRELRHSLPTERDDFVGRRAALQALGQRFDDGARLVSLLGTGGSGKTRLALHFGWHWLGDFPGGVWFCDLSQAHSLDGIVQAVALGLEVPLGKGEPVAQLAGALAGRGPCLVILDNFEQVARHAPATLGQWLDRAGEARFLVTTRERLGLPGEGLLPLAPLGIDEGVELFVRRAAALRPGLAADGTDNAALRRLVGLLDGLPLAIELAAARTVAMSTEALLQRMSDRFRLLTTRGGRQERQSTLRKTVDWSWELLSDSEKNALAQLSVFEGGFTLDRAEAVLVLPAAADAPWALDVLQSLVEKSLVEKSLIVAAASERLELLRSIQDYAAEQLAGPGRFPGSGPDAVAAAQARHARCFAALDEREAVAERCAEIGNLEAACRRAAAAGDAAAAVGALTGTWAALKLRGPYGSGIDLAAIVAAMPGLSPAQQATVDWVAGSALYSLGRSDEAKARLDAGLAVARACGDARALARLLCTLGEWLATAGRGDEALRCLDEALAHAEAAGDGAQTIKALNGLGALAQERGRMETARACYELGLDHARRQDDQRWQGVLLGNLAVLLHAQGQLDQARPCYEDALRLTRHSGDRRLEGNHHCNLGLLHHDQGRHDQARAQFEAALATARELGHPRLEAAVLCNLGLTAEAQGDLPLALACQEQAVAGARALADPQSEGRFRTCLGRLYGRLGRTADARDCLQQAEAQLIGTGDEWSLGLLLCAMAERDAADGDAALAAATLARASALADALQADPASELGLAVSACRRRLADGRR